MWGIHALMIGCRPTEVDVEADGRERSITAVAFISPPEMLINEGLPPPDRWAGLRKICGPLF